MGAFYGVRIRSGQITMNEVPKLWRAKVEKWLSDNPEIL